MTPSRTAGEEFLRELHAEHAGPLFAFALRLTGDRSRAEEVVQETLLRAWRSADRLDPTSGVLRGWLFTVARNVVTDLWRADSVRPRLANDEVTLAVVPADDVLDRATESWVVATALSRLTAEHREVLVETYYEGRSVAEAAVRLSIPSGTVKSRTFYALRALKLALEELGVSS
ncbi:MAG: sigma-70 family RNA polymerase sigma factor [Actinomycetota bacterium]|nr:sigma-70 family RNA polymerase sigma factor [Actinomycetota bacterium]